MYILPKRGKIFNKPKYAINSMELIALVVAPVKNSSIRIVNVNITMTLAQSGRKIGSNWAGVWQGCIN